MPVVPSSSRPSRSGKSPKASSQTSRALLSSGSGMSSKAPRTKPSSEAELSSETSKNKGKAVYGPYLHSSRPGAIKFLQGPARRPTPTGALTRAIRSRTAAGPSTKVLLTRPTPSPSAGNPDTRTTSQASSGISRPGETLQASSVNSSPGETVQTSSDNSSVEEKSHTTSENSSNGVTTQAYSGNSSPGEKIQANLLNILPGETTQKSSDFGDRSQTSLRQSHLEESLDSSSEIADRGETSPRIHSPKEKSSEIPDRRETSKRSLNSLTFSKVPDPREISSKNPSTRVNSSRLLDLLVAPSSSLEILDPGETSIPTSGHDSEITLEAAEGLDPGVTIETSSGLGTGVTLETSSEIVDTGVTSFQLTEILNPEEISAPSQLIDDNDTSFRPYIGSSTLGILYEAPKLTPSEEPGGTSFTEYINGKLSEPPFGSSEFDSSLGFEFGISIDETSENQITSTSKFVIFNRFRLDTWRSGLPEGHPLKPFGRQPKSKLSGKFGAGILSDLSFETPRVGKSTITSSGNEENAPPEATFKARGRCRKSSNPEKLSRSSIPINRKKSPPKRKKSPKSTLKIFIPEDPIRKPMRLPEEEKPKRRSSKYSKLALVTVSQIKEAIAAEASLRMARTGITAAGPSYQNLPAHAAQCPRSSVAQESMGPSAREFQAANLKANFQQVRNVAEQSSDIFKIGVSEEQSRSSDKEISTRIFSEQSLNVRRHANCQGPPFTTGNLAAQLQENPNPRNYSVEFQGHPIAEKCAAKIHEYPSPEDYPEQQKGTHGELPTLLQGNVRPGNYPVQLRNNSSPENHPTSFQKNSSPANYPVQFPGIPEKYPVPLHEKPTPVDYSSQGTMDHDNNEVPHHRIPTRNRLLPSQRNVVPGSYQPPDSINRPPGFYPKSFPGNQMPGMWPGAFSGKGKPGIYPRAPLEIPTPGSCTRPHSGFVKPELESSSGKFTHQGTSVGNDTVRLHTGKSLGATARGTPLAPFSQSSVTENFPLDFSAKFQGEKNSEMETEEYPGGKKFRKIAPHGMAIADNPANSQDDRQHYVNIEQLIERSHTPQVWTIDSILDASQSPPSNMDTSPDGNSGTPFPFSMDKCSAPKESELVPSPVFLAPKFDPASHRTVNGITLYAAETTKTHSADASHENAVEPELGNDHQLKKCGETFRVKVEREIESPQIEIDTDELAPCGHHPRNLIEIPLLDEDGNCLKSEFACTMCNREMNGCRKSARDQHRSVLKSKEENNQEMETVPDGTQDKIKEFEQAQKAAWEEFLERQKTHPSLRCNTQKVLTGNSVLHQNGFRSEVAMVDPVPCNSKSIYGKTFLKDGSTKKTFVCELCLRVEEEMWDMFEHRDKHHVGEPVNFLEFSNEKDAVRYRCSAVTQSIVQMHLSIPIHKKQPPVPVYLD